MELAIKPRIYLSGVLKEWLDYSKVGNKSEEGTVSQRKQEDLENCQHIAKIRGGHYGCRWTVTQQGACSIR